MFAISINFLYFLSFSELMAYYLCRSNHEIPEGVMRHVSANLRCSISVVGKIMDRPNWDYNLERKYRFNDSEKKILAENGLEIIIDDEVAERLAKANEKNIKMSFR